MRKILVTGGAGNIGGSLVRKLIEDPDNYVVVADNFITGDHNKLPSAQYSNWKAIKSDINDYKDISAIMLAYQFDFVFHYAALVGVQRTLDNPIAVLRDIEGIKHILSLSKNTGVKRIFYSSSSEVYGEPVEVPQNERTTPLNSRLPYAIVKNVGEAYFKSFHQEYGLNYTIFRFFNTYGPLQSADFVITRFLHAALKDDAITIYGEGNQSRTFCYIDDNIDLTLQALHGNYFVNDVVNVGNDEEISILDLANRIKKEVNSKSVLKFIAPLKEGDMTRRQPDIGKMKSVLKRPLTTLEEGIQKIVAWQNQGRK
jgi:nucleoside-diphosphate-sugar epimerase